MGERRFLARCELVLFPTDIGADCGICNSLEILPQVPKKKIKSNKNSMLKVYFASGTAVAMSQVHQKSFTEDVLSKGFVFGGVKPVAWFSGISECRYQMNLTIVKGATKWLH